MFGRGQRKPSSFMKEFTDLGIIDSQTKLPSSLGPKTKLCPQVIS